MCRGLTFVWSEAILRGHKLVTLRENEMVNIYVYGVKAQHHRATLERKIMEAVKMAGPGTAQMIFIESTVEEADAEMRPSSHLVAQGPEEKAVCHMGKLLIVAGVGMMVVLQVILDVIPAPA